MKEMTMKINRMEKDFKGKDEEYAPMPVVSPTTGEGSAVKQ